MTDKQVWLVTGAGRGMGTDIARVALDLTRVRLASDLPRQHRCEVAESHLPASVSTRPLLSMAPSGWPMCAF